MTDDKGTETQDDLNYWIVRGMINLAALGLFGGIIALIVATVIAGTD